MGEKTPKITALTAGQAAKILSAAGGRKVTEDQVDRDLAAGAPVNGDGTINLVHYTAWLAKEMARGD